MATTTTKLSLIKPELTDVVDVGNLNDNADSIDAAIGFTVCTSSSRPASPWSGQPIFETDTGLSLVWDGDSWEPAGGGGGGVTISATAPAAPSAGDMWWDSDDGELYLYYNDGTSSQWVAAAGPSVTVAATAPTGYEGQLWLDSTDGSMYVYYTDPGGANAQWIGAVSRSGGILQVVSTTKTDTFTSSSAGFTDITGLSASITPSSASSKIYCVATVNGASTTGNDSSRAMVRLLRDATAIAVGDANGSRTQMSFNLSTRGTNSGKILMNGTVNFLDSPATTSATTYKMQVASEGVTAFINRQESDADNSDVGLAVSTITLMEVAG